MLSDSTKVVYEDDTFQLRERCNRGYDPFWTLHKKRTLLGYSWWKFVKWGDLEPLQKYIGKWNKWPEYDTNKEET